MTVASVGSPALVVGYENPRSWWEQWAAVGHYLSELRGAYQPEASIPNDDMKRHADQFFIACWHMCDWLINDATLPEVTEQLVEAFIEEHHPLQVCRAYANTAKHLELRKPERLRARVIRFHHSPVGRQLDVEYWSSTQPARTVDALELAEQSIAAWTTLLDHHGLTPSG
jgi:hypothetical protein